MLQLKPLQRWGATRRRHNGLVVCAGKGFDSSQPQQPSQRPPEPVSRFPEIFLAQRQAEERARKMKKFASERMFTSFTSEEKWREVDKEVNKYPAQRVFSAIGTGDDDFKACMIKAVESVLGPVHSECITQTPSSSGKYISVRIGPVWVQNPDQVVEVFNNMRKDQRLKWYM